MQSYIVVLLSDFMLPESDLILLHKNIKIVFFARDCMFEIEGLEKFLALCLHQAGNITFCQREYFLPISHIKGS